MFTNVLSSAKLKPRYFLAIIFALFGLVTVPNQAQANCSDSIASLDLVRPPMERYWQKLKQQKTYTWGTVRPFGKIEKDTITLTPEFETLTGKKKQQVLAALKLEYNDNWFSLLSPEEQKLALQNPGIGAISPYIVYASDGRLVSAPYSGCTRYTLLTEAERYSWYYRQNERLKFQNNVKFNPANISDALRNAGRPSWRQVKFPITSNAEKAVRQKFWQTVGAPNQNGVYWIAWVPEHGYFEINVKADMGDRYFPSLRRFASVAPRQYRYVVVDSDGTLLQKSIFK